MLMALEAAGPARMEAQRLSPPYVWVHATDPELRRALLGRPRVRRELLPVMERLAKAGIAMHAQIVLCPGWNDGPHLDRTVHELARLHPAVPTTAVVPVGLTRHRERLPDLRAVTMEEAGALVGAIEGWQREFRDTLGTPFVWAADELYLQAGPPLARARGDEGFAGGEGGHAPLPRLPGALPRPGPPPGPAGPPVGARRPGPPGRAPRPVGGGSRRRRCCARSSPSWAAGTGASPRSSPGSSAAGARSCATCPASRATASTAPSSSSAGRPPSWTPAASIRAASPTWCRACAVRCSRRWTRPTCSSSWWTAAPASPASTRTSRGCCASPAGPRCSRSTRWTP